MLSGPSPRYGRLYSKPQTVFIFANRLGFSLGKYFGLLHNFFFFLVRGSLLEIWIHKFLKNNHWRVLSKWKFSKYMFSLCLTKRLMFLKEGSAWSYFLLLSDLISCLSPCEHWVPATLAFVVSPACRPCSAPGHWHRSLPCLACSLPCTCKAGSHSLETQMWILTEDVLGYPPVVSVPLFGPVTYHILLSYFVFGFLFFSSP